MQPWIEKYRPATLKEITSQQETIRVLSNATANLPHMLFYGPPGSGKTSSILALCHSLFFSDFSSRVLQLNASDERGIDIIRTRIKSFAKTSIKPSSSPPFKIIILDEADSMTHDAQSALRRVMEEYSKITRFCLICNYVTRIIEPITSRCAKFRFESLSVESMFTRLDEIAKLEDMTITKTDILKLIKASDGDMRRGVMYLQAMRDGKAQVDQVAGLVDDSLIVSLLEGIKNASVDDTMHVVQEIVSKGFNCNQVLAQLTELLITDQDTTSLVRSQIMWRIAHIDKLLVDGCDEFVQLSSLVCW